MTGRSELSNIPLDREGIWDIVLGMERKAISFRDLGYGFATHLLESGVDLRYIQEHQATKAIRPWKFIPYE